MLILVSNPLNESHWQEAANCVIVEYISIRKYELSDSTYQLGSKNAVKCRELFQLIQTSTILWKT